MSAPASVGEKASAVFDIEAVGAQGDGLAVGGVFVPFTLPGERVRARLDGHRGEMAELLAASPQRVRPPCPHFGACGGCALQHWDHPSYLAWKVARVEETLRRAGFAPHVLPPFAVPPGSRRRLALHARSMGSRVALGFKGRRSWTLEPIETCVIAAPALVRALPALRALAGPFLGGRRSAPTLHVTATATGLDIDVTGVEAGRRGLERGERARVAAIAAAADFARVSLSGEILYQERPAVVRVAGVGVELPCGGFLQAVEAAETAMAAFVVARTAGARRIADLYCGIGPFALALAGVGEARRAVRAADVSAPAIAALGRAAGAAGRPLAAEARDLERRPLLAAELAGFDAAVIDPPRAGAPAQMRQLAESGVGMVISVSCDLASFARDGAVLGAAGYRLETVWPIDQFLWSPHIELIGVFIR